jgi:hypothetical protein
LLELMLDEPSACFPHVTLKHQVDPHAVLRLYAISCPLPSLLQSLCCPLSVLASFTCLLAACI